MTGVPCIANLRRTLRPIVKEGCDLTFAWGEYSGFYTLSSKGNSLIELTILLILRRNMEVPPLSISEDFRTPVLGQAVNQSAELRSALAFFATAHSFPERTLESVNCTGFEDVIALLRQRNTSTLCWPWWPAKDRSLR